MKRYKKVLLFLIGSETGYRISRELRAGPLYHLRKLIVTCMVFLWARAWLRKQSESTFEKNISDRRFEMSMFLKVLY
jgi:hypothetical protein